MPGMDNGGRGGRGGGGPGGGQLAGAVDRVGVEALAAGHIRGGTTVSATATVKARTSAGLSSSI